VLLRMIPKMKSIIVVALPARDTFHNTTKNPKAFYPCVVFSSSRVKKSGIRQYVLRSELVDHFSPHNRSIASIYIPSASELLYFSTPSFE
jgi:hypothetical protein